MIISTTENDGMPETGESRILVHQPRESVGTSESLEPQSKTAPRHREQKPPAGARIALLVEDDSATREAMTALTRREGFEVDVASSLEEATVAIQRRTPHVILCDLVLPDGDGLSMLSQIDTDKTDLVVITGKSTVNSVVMALRNGALDYLTKPVDVERLRQILQDVAAARGCAESRAESLDDARESGRFAKLVGRSPEMLKLYHRILRVAPTEATVLLQGETGTGKELVAMTIHELSTRRGEPFVALNCGAVSQTLIESELFGHERGAFTGADRRHLGVFERAQNGTLFLDEITEMPMDLQVKLLRVLESRTFNRVGGEQTITTNARMIAATNRSPEDAIRQGKLREDLFYRLRVFPMHLPPLHARTGDPVLLANEFVATHNRAAGTKKKLGDDARAWIEAQPWPGNVRELRNVIERAFIMADDVIDGSCIRLDDEPSKAVGPDVAACEGDEIRVRVGSTIAHAEKALILATLKHYGGDKSTAAKVLGISVKTLYTRLSVYNASESL